MVEDIHSLRSPLNDGLPAALLTADPRSLSGLREPSLPGVGAAPAAAGAAAHDSDTASALATATANAAASAAAASTGDGDAAAVASSAEDDEQESSEVGGLARPTPPRLPDGGQHLTLFDLVQRAWAARALCPGYDHSARFPRTYGAVPTSADGTEAPAAHSTAANASIRTRITRPCCVR